MGGAETDEGGPNSRWGDLRVVLFAAVLTGIVAAIASAFDAVVVETVLVAGIGAMVQPFIRALASTFDDAVSSPSRRVVRRCLAFIAVAGVTYGLAVDRAAVSNLQGEVAEALPLVYPRSANQEDVVFTGAEACQGIDVAVGFRSYLSSGTTLNDVVIWQRRLGRRWREAVDAEAFGGVNTTASGQTASRQARGVGCGARGVPVAYGWDTATDGSGFADGAIWHLRDDRWSRIGDDHFGGDGAQAIIHLSHGARSDVLRPAGGTGGPLSGSRGPTSSVAEQSVGPVWAAIWTSTVSDGSRVHQCSWSADGASWTDLGTLTYDGDPFVPASVDFADGLFVAHAEDSTEVAIYTSRNCREWTRAGALPLDLAGQNPRVNVMRLHRTWIVSGWIDGVPVLFEAAGDGPTGWRSLAVGKLGSAGSAGVYAVAGDADHGFVLAWDTARDGNSADERRGENLVISLEHERADSIHVPLIGDLPRTGVLTLR